MRRYLIFFSVGLGLLMSSIDSTVVAVAFGIFAFIPLYATSVLKLSTLVSGMILTPRSLGAICASALTSFLLKRWGYRWPMGLGMSLISLSTVLLGGEGFQLLRMVDTHLGVTGILVILIMGTGIGIGILLPAANNACIELMPDRVATITGLRGLFRSVGGVLGISVITIILHLSSTPANGFRITFISFGLGLLLTLPLVFLMPSGKVGERRVETDEAGGQSR
jgi:MFS family permease